MPWRTVERGSSSASGPPVLPAIRRSIGTVAGAAAVGDSSPVDEPGRGAPTALLATAPAHLDTGADPSPTNPGFWLYSSWVDRPAKGAPSHIIRALNRNVRSFMATRVLRHRRERTSTFSLGRPELFFAYGLGNGARDLFPMAVRRHPSVLMTEAAPNTASVSRGPAARTVPTDLFTVLCHTLQMRCSPATNLPAPGGELALRRCSSAGDPLPPEHRPPVGAPAGGGASTSSDGIVSTELLATSFSATGRGRCCATGHDRSPFAGYAPADRPTEEGRPRPPARASRRPSGPPPAAPTMQRATGTNRERQQETYLNGSFGRRNRDSYFED